MVLLIDNYDSFTWNLAQALGALGVEPLVYRNDDITVEGAESLNPEALVISPGPCTPGEAGVSVPLVQRLSGRLPILGVCLGHQAVGAAFGGAVVRARRVMHGKVSNIEHVGRGIFEGVASPFPATRYHSLVVAEDSLPEVLRVVAWSVEPDGTRTIQGLKHKVHETWGVQFHPESVMTGEGPKILANFLRRAGCRVSSAPGS